MKCPICTSIDLVMAERQGIEIDYCPTCRGVWLDRGELDKIIERSIGQTTILNQEPPTHLRQDQHKIKNDLDHKGCGEHHGSGHYRRKSWLGELFD